MTFKASAIPAGSLPVHDVIIAGRGAIGCAAALGLAQAGLRVALVGAVGHSKLADRVGSLEHVMGSVVTELRGMRDAFERNGVIRPAFGSVDEPIPPASVTQGRRSVPSRAQL